MRKIKNVILLAGGDSTRFWPLKEKSLFYFLGTPLISYQLEKLSQFFEKILIITSKTNSDKIKRIIGNSNLKIKQDILIQNDLEGQAGAILSAKKSVKGEALVLNVNDVFDFSILDELISQPFQKNKIIFFGKKINEYFPGGYFKLDNNNNILEIIEKPGKDNMPSNLVKLVIDYYSDIEILIKELEEIKSSEDNHYELAMNRLLKTKVDRELKTYNGYWQSLKFPWHVLPMMKLFLDKIKTDKISSTAEISKNAIISGPVYIEDKVKIGDFVKITGPCYIGANTIIGDYSLIRESQIGADCLIGSYSEVARSYIGNKVFLHRNYVGDSVLDDRSMMGAQAVTANYRFDEKTVGDSSQVKLGAIIGQETKIGVNATLLPGIKIGSKTWVNPGETIRKDIKDNQYFIKGLEKQNSKI